MFIKAIGFSNGYAPLGWLTAVVDGAAKEWLWGWEGVFYGWHVH